MSENYNKRATIIFRNPEKRRLKDLKGWIAGTFPMKRLVNPRFLLKDDHCLQFAYRRKFTTVDRN